MAKDVVHIEPVSSICRDATSADMRLSDIAPVSEIAHDVSD